MRAIPIADLQSIAGPAQRKLGGLCALVAGRAGVLRCALIAVALAGMPGCATLPDAAHDQAQPHPQQVEFEDAHGPVPDARSNAILGRLEEKTGASDVLQAHMAYEQALNADSPLVLGNKLTLLQNGPATYQAMFAAMRAATDSINLETFIFADDEAGRQFSQLLLERQAAGVQVNVIRDSAGSSATPAAFFETLHAAGIAVLEFNPINPLDGNGKAWLPNNRDHRKLMVIDGKTAFVGGINIVDSYSTAPSRWRKRQKYAHESRPTTGWRDTHVQIEGPVVAEFQKLFLDTWARQKGEPLATRNYLPELPVRGDEIVRAIGSTPEDNESLIFLTLVSAISHAQLSVHLTIAYFAPDPQLLAALMDAARRGVDVELILPSYTDSWAIFNLGHRYYTGLLRAGVRISERRGAIMHSKTACIDGVWSTIGSTNLDWRSFLHNDEINAVILGRNFAAQMESMFAQDLEESGAITLEQWRRRPMAMRVKEKLAQVAAYWL